MSGGRWPVAALLLVALLAGEATGRLDTAAVARFVGTHVVLAAATGALRGYNNVLDSHSTEPASPRRKPRPEGSGGPRGGPPAGAGIPDRYGRLYQQAGAGERWCTRAGDCYRAQDILAAIGQVESVHGQSSAPGVRSGVNRHGCCAGPMQFNLRDGPPSTWATWGRGNVYDPADAIPAAARKLRGQGARHNLDRALYRYNADWPYVVRVKRLARTYQTRRV